MRYSSVFVLVLAVTGLFVQSVGASVFINEIHYDNDGGDVDEGIEVAGPAGQDLSGWSILLYNGNDGRVYNTFTLSGTIADQQNGFGTLFFYTPGIQNGPDGMALVDNGDSVVQFLSYEGPFVATDGLASGITSTDIGVSEGAGTLVGYSLQLLGDGREYEDFSWSESPILHTRGEINTGQAFVPIPGAVWLLGSGLTGLVVVRKRKTGTPL